MSLVAYGSSDESSDNEETVCDREKQNKTTSEVISQQTNDKLYLPTPKHDTFNENGNENDIHIKITKTNEPSEKIHFDKLPKPKSLIIKTENIIEEDDVPLKKEIHLKPEKPIKRDRVPVKIIVPSLSEFKDLETENESKLQKAKPSNGTKLFALLPPPKGIELKSTSNLVPNAVNKNNAKISQTKVQATKDICTKNSDTRKTTKMSIGANYDSNSEDEDDTTISDSKSATDFFALTATDNVLDSDMPDSSHITTTDSSNLNKKPKSSSNTDSILYNYITNSSGTTETEVDMNNSQKTLTSNVINLPKEEILLKNKAEVGPKLPIPEQEYNVDTEGNVAFDDKAIEYLCGRRGVKRKPKEIEEANVIEINGEDIKPDEREWLVKALTEEPVQRPISMQGGGINSQSKKKHQITYLAHQAKAMEMELKNQWAQNRLTRKQTQSKYGF
ncbi:uncharacterized protein LOC143423668 isoform X2 [Xylocopa sonorina]|uniref:uncharacterized protein LOC143423668 isoform X2 n=1 Tax=Xylocopa sonorina TaxID=1818115 RepID=UPI00403AAAF1